MLNFLELLMGMFLMGMLLDEKKFVLKIKQ